MKRIEIKQLTPEWFELKHGKIGGSTSKGLFVKTNTLMLDILSQKTEDFEFIESFSNDAMENGLKLEPFIQEQMNQYANVEFQNVGWLQCEENSLLGISPDGITADNKISYEGKALGRKKHTEVIFNDVIPMDYIHQCLHYFTVNPQLEKHYFCAFRPQHKIKPLFVKELTRYSLIDIGWKTKKEILQYGVKGNQIKSKFQTVADIRTINEWVEVALNLAKEIELEINESIEKMKF